MLTVKYSWPKSSKNGVVINNQLTLQAELLYTKSTSVNKKGQSMEKAENANKMHTVEPTVTNTHSTFLPVAHKTGLGRNNTQHNEQHL